MNRTVASTKVVGLLEWFRIGEYERVEAVLSDMDRLGVTHLRTGLSWADWHTPQGETWYRWLLPRLAQEVEVLPCFVYTPPSLGVAPKTSSPPRRPKDYADFIDLVITDLGYTFEWIELWNEPNNMSEWDWTLDPHWYIFCEMIGGAAHWAQQRGKKTALAGMSPPDPNWLNLMLERGLIDHIDAVGLHGFPGVWEQNWAGWAAHVAKIRNLLGEYEAEAEVWITETGYSTWQHDQYGQLQAFVEALQAPPERVYWYAAHDLHPEEATIDGFHLDEREYHFGLKRADGTPKLLFRLWAEGGTERVFDFLEGEKQPAGIKKEKLSDLVLITGGAGFIGTNLADAFLTQGRPVLLFDNLSRPGVERNFQWLSEKYGSLVQIEIADIRNAFGLKNAVRRASQVFHLAGQTAVTTSLKNPVYDFEVNARGTLNLLEAMRTAPQPPSLVFASTNKVYGAVDHIPLLETPTRYEPRQAAGRANGVGESFPLDLHSPYGCSKGAADQYVRDYARLFDLPAVVFRMSCIYGPHQFGTEDQGWVAHFLIQTLNEGTITLYGDGKQVRDILFVEDLVAACLVAQENMAALAGRVFNIGGGPQNVTSLLELLDMIEVLHGRRPRLAFGRQRPGDQRYYVSDVRSFAQATGWQPRVEMQAGLEQLYHWLAGRRSHPVLHPILKEISP